jgi:hypothetical protein
MQQLGNFELVKIDRDLLYSAGIQSYYLPQLPRLPMCILELPQSRLSERWWLWAHRHCPSFQVSCHNWLVQPANMLTIFYKHRLDACVTIVLKSLQELVCTEVPLNLISTNPTSALDASASRNKTGDTNTRSILSSILVEQREIAQLTSHGSIQLQFTRIEKRKDLHRQVCD